MAYGLKACSCDSLNNSCTVYTCIIMNLLIIPWLFFPIQIGKLIENITLVVDMENVGVQILYRPFLDIYSEMLKIFEANYPETLHTCFVINGMY